ncbi:thiosulfate sulfurtransferase PspE [Kluyvera genomosp. 1]|uniref:thiosulfate sulfurtransferase PspE n=1 Tax=Kluyvera genomosp. 1 TaxID=2774053 RepID=UPI00068A9975|nr:thiosulfate sulfurtransferase PspE [Kluyvera genomosp. 1]
MLTPVRLLKNAVMAGAIVMASTTAWAAEHWIDVRSAEQFQETHVQGAVNIPLKELSQRIGEVTQDKNDTLYLYCNTGNQSAKAETLLQKMGYKNAVNEGGLKDVEKKTTLVK